MYKLNIAEVIKITISKYKENWRILILITSLMSLISLSTEILALITNDIESRLFIVVFSFVATLIGLYFLARLSVSLILSICKIIKGEDNIFIENYRIAKDITWQYIGNSILYGLALTMPVMMIGLGFVIGVKFDWSILTRVVIGGLGIISAIYISTIFYFVLNLTVIYPKENVFLYSKNLIRGNFIKMVLIVIVSSMVSIPGVYLSRQIQVSEYHLLLNILASFGINIMNMIIWPFFILLGIVIINKIENIKDK
jgi:hypothetical protein